MNLQETFYALGIIAMISLIIFNITALYTIFYLRREIKSAKDTIINKIIEYTKPVDVIKGLSSSIIGNIFLKLRDNLASHN